MDRCSADAARSPPRLTDGAGPAGEDIGDLLVELVDHLDAMVAYWDGDQRCRFANQAYQGWFGRSRQELLGMTLLELLGPLYELNRPHIDAAYAGQRQVFERAIPRPNGDGVRHSLATYVPRIVDGRVQGIFVHVADVEPLKKLEMELMVARDQAERLASHDHLTGLPNRRLLEDRLDDALRRATRTGERVFALSIDVDHFKDINDSHGHAVGDALLTEIAVRITSCVRDYDTVSRLGGDEFFVLVRGALLEEGIELLAIRLLRATAGPWRFAGGTLEPSISIGIAEFPRNGGTKGELMLASDDALYDAKRAGRNCYRVAEAGTISRGPVADT